MQYLKSVLFILSLVITLLACDRLENFERQFFWFSNQTEVISYDSLFVQTQLRDEGSKSFSQHGYCYSSSDSLPTLAHQVIDLGVGGSRNFQTYLTGLVPNTLYYMRTFVVVEGEVIYDDNIVSAQTNSILELGKLNSQDLKNYGFIATVSPEYPLRILEYGVVWATNPKPTISDEKLSLTSPTLSAGESYTTTLSTLTDNVQYYARAYLISEKDTTYSDSKSFFVPRSDPNN